MKRFFLLLLGALFIGAWLFQLLEQYPVYVLIHAQDVNIEVNLWFAVGVLLMVTFTIWLLIKVFNIGIVGTAIRVKRLIVGSDETIRKKTAKGLIYFIEGDWKKAHRLLMASAPKSQTPLVNYLAASRSAFEMGDNAAAFDLLAKAQDSTANAELAVALSQAKMQLLSQRYEQCAATLQRAAKHSSNHPVVLDLMRQVYLKLEDWSALQNIMAPLLKTKCLSGAQQDELQQLVYVRLLQSCGQEIGKTGANTSEPNLDAVWKKIPTRWQHHSAVTLAYVAGLVHQGQQEKAGSLIVKALKKNWCDDLVTEYGLLQLDDVHKQLLQAEKWLKARPSNGVLLLTLGRLSLRNRMWDKARDYFTASIKRQATHTAHMEMARLLSNQGDLVSSLEHHQKGLILGGQQLPELPLPSVSEYDS